MSCFWAAAAVLLTRSAHAHIPSCALRRYKQGTANCQTMGTLLLDVQTTTTTRCAARLLLSPWRNTDTTTTRRGSFPPVCTLPNELGNGSRTFPFLSHCTPSSRLVQRRSRTMTQDALSRCNLEVAEWDLKVVATPGKASECSVQPLFLEGCWWVRGGGQHELLRSNRWTGYRGQQQRDGGRRCPPIHPTCRKLLPPNLSIRIPTIHLAP